MEDKDYYKIIGLTEEDKKLKWEDFEKKLKKIFRTLSLKYHPDKMSGNTDKEKKEAEEKFKDITEAYNILSDKQKKAEYDNRRSMGDGFGNEYGAGSWWNEMMRQQAEEARRASMKGDDIQIDVNLTIKEVYTGIFGKDIAYQGKNKCPDCNGTGSSDGKLHICPHCHGKGKITETHSYGPGMTMMTERICHHCHGTGHILVNPCKKCSGTGYVWEERHIKIDVRPGMIEGLTVQYAGYGDPPKQPGGENGNLYITFHEIHHPKFKRSDFDIHTNVDFNIKEAWLGCDKEIECIDGRKVRMHIPPMTKNGAQFKLKGKGIPSYKNPSIYGNMIVEVSYALPANRMLTDRQKELIDEFIEIENEKLKKKDNAESKNI